MTRKSWAVQAELEIHAPTFSNSRPKATNEGLDVGFRRTLPPAARGILGYSLILRAKRVPDARAQHRTLLRINLGPVAESELWERVARAVHDGRR